MLTGDFPDTRWSLIVNARQDGGRLDEWCQKYHPAIVRYLMALGCAEDEAQDIAQEFFFRLLVKGPQRVLPEDLRGSFRAYLKRSVRNFLIDQRRAQLAQKHGAGAEHVPLANIEEHLADGPDSPARKFDQSWLLAIMGNAIEMLRSEYRGAEREALFESLLPYLDGKPGVDYEEIASRFQLSQGAFRALLFRVRKKYRSLIEAEIRETVATEEQWQEEKEYLLSLWK